MAMPDIDQKRGLQLIHIAKSQLGMDDETYRAMLSTVAGVKSAKDLDGAGRDKVLQHLKRCGFKPKAKPDSAGRNKHVKDRPNNYSGDVRGNQIKKIEALLADAGRPWSYAAGLAKKMFKVDALEFCDPDHLQKLIAALVYDQKRREVAAINARNSK